MNITEALENMVDVAIRSMQMDNAMCNMGYEENPYGDIYVCAFDAIYHLIGERTEEVTDSLTYTVLNDPELTNPERVDILLGR